MGCRWQERRCRPRGVGGEPGQMTGADGPIGRARATSAGSGRTAGSRAGASALVVGGPRERGRHGARDLSGRIRAAGGPAGPLPAGRDPSRGEGLLAGRPSRRRPAPRARLRTREPGDRGIRAPGRRRLLLPPQAGAREPGLRRAEGHLHDVRRHRGLAHPPRLRPACRPCRGDRTPAGGTRGRPRPVRRERAERGRLHLRLLRPLLRGDDRDTPVREARPRPHDELSPARRGGAVQRVRQVRERLPGRGDDARLGERPTHAEEAEGDARPGCLPGLWGLHPRLPDGRAPAGGARPARDHARRHAPPHRPHGDRAQSATGLRLRRQGPVQPPGDGGGARRDPPAAAAQAGDGDRANAIALSREHRGQREAEAGGGSPGLTCRGRSPGRPVRTTPMPARRTHIVGWITPKMFPSGSRR